MRKQFFALCVIIIALCMIAGCTPTNSNAPLEVNSRQCKGCAQCLPVCRVDAIRIVGEKAIIDVSKCIKCGNCVEVCPVNAIH